MKKVNKNIYKEYFFNNMIQNCELGEELKHKITNNQNKGKTWTSRNENKIKKCFTYNLNDEMYTVNLARMSLDSDLSIYTYTWVAVTALSGDADVYQSAMNK